MNQPDPAEIENRVEAAIKAVGKPGDAWAVEFVQTVRPLLAALATERAEKGREVENVRAALKASEAEVNRLRRIPPAEERTLRG